MLRSSDRHGRSDRSLSSLRRLASRRRSFIGSSRWTLDGDGVRRIGRDGRNIAVAPVGREFQRVVNEVPGKRRFPTLPDAKDFVFESGEGGELDRFLVKHGVRHAPGTRLSPRE